MLNSLNFARGRAVPKIAHALTSHSQAYVCVSVCVYWCVGVHSECSVYFKHRQLAVAFLSESWCALRVVAFAGALSAGSECLR